MVLNDAKSNLSILTFLHAECECRRPITMCLRSLPQYETIPISSRIGRYRFSVFADIPVSLCSLFIVKLWMVESLPKSDLMRIATASAFCVTGQPFASLMYLLLNFIINRKKFANVGRANFFLYDNFGLNAE